MTWWARLFGQGRLNQELDEEIRAHMRMAVQDRIARGESTSSAEASARREFGNQLLTKEVTRQMWTWNWLDKFSQDLRYIFRQMRRSPGFTAIAVLTLALGLGATTAMFSIVNGVLLQPLPYHDSDRLFLARTVPPARFKIGRDFPINARHFHEWREKCQSCEQVSLLEFADMTLVAAGQPQKLPTLMVSSNFFKTLDVQPVLGRDFLREEEPLGRSGEVILSDQLWRSSFSADRSVIGRGVQLNGETYTVIGVMPADLRLPKGEEWGGFFGPSANPLIFRPLGLDTARASSNGNLNYTSLIRTKPGVGAQAVAAELTALIEPFHARTDPNSKSR